MDCLSQLITQTWYVTVTSSSFDLKISYDLRYHITTFETWIQLTLLLINQSTSFYVIVISSDVMNFLTLY